MSATTEPKPARRAAPDHVDAKLNSILRRLDELPTRFHLMAVCVAAGGFWALVVVVAAALLR